MCIRDTPLHRIRTPHGLPRAKGYAHVPAVSLREAARRVTAPQRARVRGIFEKQRGCNNKPDACSREGVAVRSRKGEPCTAHPLLYRVVFACSASVATGEGLHIIIIIILESELLITLHNTNALATGCNKCRLASFSITTIMLQPSR